MTSSSISRGKFLGVVSGAFLGGLVVASGFDLTPLGHAQQTRPAGRTAPPASAIATVADLNNSFTSIAESVTPAVVSIQAERTESDRNRPRDRRRNTPPGLDDFFRQFDPQLQQPQQASGTGFIVSRDGYILTNNHVVADFDRVNVTLLDHRVFRARVVGRDPTTDVAVIKIDAGDNLPVAALGNDEAVRIGEWVLAIGNPLGLDFTVTAGIVSAKGRGSNALPNLNTDPFAVTDFIQTDAAINPGNSGGPLVNIRGEVIGINSAIASQTGFYSGYGFAIPVTLAREVMDDIIKHGRVRRAVLGIQIAPVEQGDAAVAGLKTIAGVKVGGFSGDDSPAQRAGMQPGDIIIEADGKPVDRVAALQRIIRAHEPGETVEIVAMRYGDRKSFRVRLTEAPSETQTAARTDADASALPAGAVTEKLGISVEPLSAEVARANRIPDERRGLRVAEVSGDGPARRDLIEGDILVEVLYPVKRELRSLADLQSALARMKEGEYVSLLVYDARPRVRNTRVVNIRIGGI